MIEEQIADEMKEEDECSAETGKNVTPDDTATASSSSAIGIRPKPVIRKPENAVSAGCKSEPLETKWQWAPGAWQDATRTSAFQPYKVRVYFRFRKTKCSEIASAAKWSIYLLLIFYLDIFLSRIYPPASYLADEFAKRQHSDSDASAVRRE